jgi:acetyl esterase/lipase
MKYIRLFVCAFLSSCFILSLNGQNQIVKVWPEGIPGSFKNETYTEKMSETNGEISRFDKVTDPAMYVYLPAAEKATGTAVLICPGGAYGTLAFGHEGIAVAKWFNENGIAGIVLKYRLPSDLIMKDKSIGPLQDVQEAMRIIRRNSNKWNINPAKVGVMGFSAGGHLASSLSTHFAEKVYQVADTTSARPDFSFLIYPVITFDETFTHSGSRKNLIGDKPTEEAIRHFSNELQIDKNTPPAFLVHSADDKTVPVKNSIVYFEGLQKNGILTELHIFQKGGHGYGLSTGKGTQSAWSATGLAWLKANGF